MPTDKPSGHGRDWDNPRPPGAPPNGLRITLEPGERIELSPDGVMRDAAGNELPAQFFVHAAPPPRHRRAIVGEVLLWTFATLGVLYLAQIIAAAVRA